MTAATQNPKIVKTLAQIWGGAVHDRRRRLHMSQARLAELCDVRQQTISRIECGLAIPSDNLKVHLAANLRASPRTLFRWPPLRELMAA